MSQATLTLVPAAAQEQPDEKWFWTHACDKWAEIDPADLAPRRWIYGGHYLEGAVSATIADGGVGKSTLTLTEAIAIVTGRALLGITPPKQFYDGQEETRGVLYYNAEESLDEIKRRVLAICQQFGINREELVPLAPDGLTGLMVVSGHDYPLVLAAPGPEGVTFSDDLKWIEAYEGNVVILDPLVSLHHCQENDNSALDALVKRLGRIAATPPIKSIELVHHARKPAQGGNVEISTADARGASAIAAGARSVRVLNRITEGEALRANVKDSRRFFRADAAKTNYTAGAVPSHWYQHVSIILPNGDDVGVVAPWQFPGAFDGVTTAHMHQVRELARGGTYRSDPRSPDWIGNAVADVLDLDIENEADAKRIKTILKEWYGNGVLKKVERRGADRHLYMFVEPGDWKEP